MNACLRTVFFASLIMMLSGLTTRAQKKVERASVKDTLRPDLVSRVRNLIDSSLKSEVELMEARRVNAMREERIEEIKSLTRNAGNYLRKGIDSTGIKLELEKIEKWYDDLGKGVFENRDSVLTHRNLATSGVILQELIFRMNDVKTTLDAQRKTISGFTRAIDSLSLDSVIWTIPGDSAGLVNFLRELMASANEVKLADSIRKQAEGSVANLQKQVNPVVSQLQASLEEIERRENRLSGQLFEKEINPIWQPGKKGSSLTEIFKLSERKTSLALRFFLRDNKGKLFGLFLLIGTVTLFLSSLKKIVRLQKQQETVNRDSIVIRSPFLSACVIVPSIYQFIFINPPNVFYEILWAISAVSLTLILRGFISAYWMRAWLSMLILGFLAGLDNLFLQYSPEERWWVLYLALAGVASGLFILLGGHRRELRENAILIFIGFVVVLESCSVLANVTGRYNLAKSLMTTGYFNVVISIVFLWTIRLINDGLALASRYYDRQDRSLFFVNFEKVGSKASPIFYFFMISGWLFLLGKNFYAFKLLIEPVREFILLERKMGDFSFSIGNLLLFFLILGVSVITSRFVSFFASDDEILHVNDSNRPVNKLGSWLLLIRITIITLGLLLAFAATGIPMDRITIILGALGVGVGLGLQALVNNLVSGLIIAFEKPVNVGDIVEIDGQSGTVKSIGFRSSTIKKFDGSNVILPNGDLLNSRLVNWTRDSSRRRVEIAFGISYGTDLDEVKIVLQDLLSSNQQILQQPKPAVLFRDMSKQLIGITIYFWTRHNQDWLAVRSDMIAEIDRVFREKGIIIPFNPQKIFGLSPDSMSNPIGPFSGDPAGNDMDDGDDNDDDIEKK